LVEHLLAEVVAHDRVEKWIEHAIHESESVGGCFEYVECVAIVGKSIVKEA
jgi:hypothetical protein